MPLPIPDHACINCNKKNICRKGKTCIEYCSEACKKEWQQDWEEYQKDGYWEE